MFPRKLPLKYFPKMSPRIFSQNISQKNFRKKFPKISSGKKLLNLVEKVHGSDEPRNIKQMQYHSWPDHGVPNKSTSLLQFVRRSAQECVFFVISALVITLKIFKKKCKNIELVSIPLFTSTVEGPIKLPTIFSYFWQNVT